MNKTTLKLILPLLLLLSSAAHSHAGGKDNGARKVIHTAGIDFRPAYLFPTNSFLKGTYGTETPGKASLSGHLKYGFKFAPDTYLGKRYPHAVQGIGIGYNTFFNPSELGNPLAVYVFQTSRIASLTQRLSLDYEWNFGASFGWKKHDENNNPLNTAVGSKINAYMSLQLLLDWEICEGTHLRAGIGASHYSNGNTNYPNSGINTMNGSIGITRHFGGGTEERHIHSAAQTFKPYISYDLIAYGATRKKGIFPENSSPIVVPGSFAIAGLNFNPMYNFSKYFRAGLSLDAQYDESANIADHIANEYLPSDPNEIRFYRPPFIEQFSVGVSARAEIVMPIFSINFGIGRNFIGKGDDLRAFYQTLALKTDITKSLFLHVGYQLYKFKDPNNLMLGIGVRFNAQGK